MLIDWVVVLFHIQIQVGVGEFPIHIMPQGAIWSSINVNILEGKMGI
jgi:hypothetical protein